YSSSCVLWMPSNVIFTSFGVSSGKFNSASMIPWCFVFGSYIPPRPFKRDDPSICSIVSVVILCDGLEWSISSVLLICSPTTAIDLVPKSSSTNSTFNVSGKSSSLLEIVPFSSDRSFVYVPNLWYAVKLLSSTYTSISGLVANSIIFSVVFDKSKPYISSSISSVAAVLLSLKSSSISAFSSFVGSSLPHAASNKAADNPELSNSFFIPVSPPIKNLDI